MANNIPQNYGIPRWGSGYFAINNQGQVVVRPNPDQTATIPLEKLAAEAKATGLRYPILMRFVDILHHRAQSLAQAFAKAAAEFHFQGRYKAVYPIKVNQQRVVVEEILRGGTDKVGLEAGSKPELLAVLALARPQDPIVCNGYKDREYIRLALIGRALGQRIHIVIEKPSELDLVLREAFDLGVAPLLGVRVRLATVANGKWQNSGGAKSKFGLSAAQLLDLITHLQQKDALHWLVLLHAHIGSQIPNIRDIRRSLAELARFYAELRRLGAPITEVDAGGGLGIDYEGTQSRHDYSINYNLETYAREVTRAITKICTAEDLPHPNLITEAGRAMTAHHAVLLVNVIDQEQLEAPDELPDLTQSANPTLRRLATEVAAINSSSPLELYHEAKNLVDETHELFEQGEMRLAERAQAEALFLALAQRLHKQLNPESRRHRELLDELDELLANRVFCNFSIFQSLPDIWGIDQVFPVIPLSGLAEKPAAKALLHDLTCDSDGCVSTYVDQDGVEATLPIRVFGENPPLLGFFLAGAYQEILGDMHNLFGDTDSVNVALTEAGEFRLSEPEKGDSVADLLRYVHFDPEDLLDRFAQKLKAASLPEAMRDSCYRELKTGLSGYSYFED